MASIKDNDEARREVALFRYGLVSDLVHLEPGDQLYAKLRERAAKDYDIPGTLRRTVAAETMRGWLRALRRGGFDALAPRTRSDIGKPRAIEPALADLLVELKDNERALSVEQVIAKALKSGKVPEGTVLAPSTVHRLLARCGLTKPAGDEPTSKDRRRFAYEKAGELWMSDAMHGPGVVVAGQRRRKAYLLALIDDATRLIPHAAFALSENTAAFLPVLERAIRRRGLPKRLYVDNGSAFRSKHLALVCAKLGITLIHARPYCPQGKGKMERFFRTVRMQLLGTLAPEDLSGVEALNRRLWAWVESEYHQNPHRGIDGDTPHDRWAMASDEVRLPQADIADLFLFEQKRKVAKDRTVSLNGVLYEVDATLVGETVTLRFDPSELGKHLQVVHEGKRREDAQRLDAYANCFVKRRTATGAVEVSRSPDTPPAGLCLRDLKQSNDEEES